MTAQKEQSSMFGQIFDSNQKSIVKIKELEALDVNSTKSRNLLFGGLSIGALGLAILFATQILTGALALIVSGLTVLGFWFGLRMIKQFDPYIRQKLKNEALMAMHREASKNAVAQLQNMVITRSENLKGMQDNLNKLSGKIKTMKNKIDHGNKESEFYKKKMAIIETFEKAESHKIDMIKKAMFENKKFEQKVAEYIDYNSFTEIAKEAEAFTQGSDKLSEMLSLTAFEAIEVEYNTAMSSLENETRIQEIANQIETELEK